MKYCCLNNQRTGSCYFEFQIGKFRGQNWRDDSLCLHEETFDRLNLYQVFAEAIPEFNYFGITEIDREKWGQIILTAHRIGGEVEEVIDEIDSWASSILPATGIMTLIGI